MRGTYWHASFRDSGGRLIQKSTRIPVKGKDRSETATFKAKAQIVATKYEMAARGEIGSVSAFRKTLQDLIDLAGADKSETLGSWVEAYLERAKDKYNSSYLSAAKNILNKLVDIVGQDTSLEAVGSESIQAVLKKRAEERATGTVHKEKKLMSKCFADAVRAGLIERNPVSAATVPKLVTVERKPFTEQEIEVMVKVAPPEWQRAIMVASMTGLRLRDCLRLKPDDYNSKLDAICVIESKTKKTLTIPVNAKLREIIQESVPDISELSSGAINKRFIKVMEDAGIEREPVEGAGRNTLYRKSFHSLRHTFISRLADAGVDPEIRRKLSGHASAEVHEIYTHHNLDRMREAITALG